MSGGVRSTRVCHGRFGHATDSCLDFPADPHQLASLKPTGRDPWAFFSPRVRGYSCVGRQYASLFKGPHPRVLLRVREDVPVHVDLVPTVPNGFHAASLRPDLPHVPPSHQHVIGVLLRLAHPLPRQRTGQSDQNVVVHRIQGQREDLRPLLEKPFHHRLAGRPTLGFVELHRRPLERPANMLPQGIPLPRRRRVPVVALNVGAVLPIAPPPRIAPKPRAVRTPRNVVPTVPSAHGRIVSPSYGMSKRPVRNGRVYPPKKAHRSRKP